MMISLVRNFWTSSYLSPSSTAVTLLVKTPEGPCSNLFAEALEAAKLSSNGPTFQLIKTERFVPPLRIALKPATIASCSFAERTELPRS